MFTFDKHFFVIDDADEKVTIRARPLAARLLRHAERRELDTPTQASVVPVVHVPIATTTTAAAAVLATNVRATDTANGHHAQRFRASVGQHALHQIPVAAAAAHASANSAAGAAHVSAHNAAAAADDAGAAAALLQPAVDAVDRANLPAAGADLPAAAAADLPAAGADLPAAGADLPAAADLPATGADLPTAADLPATVQSAAADGHRSANTAANGARSDHDEQAAELRAPSVRATSANLSDAQRGQLLLQRSAVGSATAATTADAAADAAADDAHDGRLQPQSQHEDDAREGHRRAQLAQHVLGRHRRAGLGRRQGHRDLLPMPERHLWLHLHGEHSQPVLERRSVRSGRLEPHQPVLRRVQQPDALSVQVPRAARLGPR